jgi:hypothetical protein
MFGEWRRGELVLVRKEPAENVLMMIFVVLETESGWGWVWLWL